MPVIGDDFAAAIGLLKFRLPNGFTLTLRDVPPTVGNEREMAIQGTETGPNLSLLRQSLHKVFKIRSKIASWFSVIASLAGRLLAWPSPSCASHSS